MNALRFGVRPGGLHISGIAFRVRPWHYSGDRNNRAASFAARSAAHAAATRALLFLLICASVSLRVGEAQAGQVTFAFNATVHSVANGIPFDSGLAYSEGDLVFGSFTFDSNEGSGGMNLDTSQPYSFCLVINGKALSVPSFDISSINNAAIEDVPGISTIDSLVLGAAGLTPLSSGINVDSGSSGFRITLFGLASTYVSAQIPSESSVWNSFSIWKDLNVSLRDGNGGAIGFQASINEFQRVPEPTSFSTILVVCVYICLTKTTRYCRGDSISER